MRASGLREMTVIELQDKLRKDKEALLKLRFRSTTGKLENPLKIRSTRREIARIITLISEKGKSTRAEN